MIGHRLTITALFASLLFGGLTKTHADDIEIFMGGNARATPNILFVFDTSRSMSIDEEIDLGPYDPSVTYPVPINGYVPDGLYLSRSTGVLYNGNGSTDTETNTIRKNRIHPDSIRCPGVLNSVAQSGSWSGKLKRWESGKGWSGPLLATFGLLYSTRMDANDILDCDRSGYMHNGSQYNYMTNLIHHANTPYTNTWLRRMTAIDWVEGYYNRVFSGNYLNYHLMANNSSTKFTLDRMTISRSAAKDAINSVSNINLGLMKFDTSKILDWSAIFDGGEGGFIDIPIQPIESMRATFAEKVDAYFPWGATPLVESYHEAMLYFTGGRLKYGLDTHSRQPGNIVDRQNTNLGGTKGLIISDIGGRYIHTPSVPESYDAVTKRYHAPTVAECTASEIILFTDGFPNKDTSSNAAIRELIKDMPLPLGLSRNCGGEGGCGRELAYYLANTDHHPDVPGVQRIRTHTIGSFLRGSEGGKAKTLLREIAYYGDGKYIEADDYVSLRQAIEDLLTASLETPSTFTAPTVTINSFNSFDHSDEIYFSVFRPSSTQRWQGNLKRYRLNDRGVIVDAHGNPAINSKGFFHDNAHSIWTLGNEPDGANVASGGAASRLILPRNVFTTDGTQVQPLSTSLASISKARLGIEHQTDDYRQRLIRWAMGINEDDSPRTSMEDPLHSQPLVIHYGPNDSIVLISTNSGFIHAFSTDETWPKEYFALIPQELLDNLDAHYSGGNAGELKRYGMDGQMTHWHIDHNRNGIVDGNDKVYLFVGMRRGGHSYYALDITERSQPKIVWQIHGEYPAHRINAPTVTPGFERLGQTWSALIPAEIMWQGQRKTVLFASGGYDIREDGTDMSGPSQRLAHTQGNTLYMIDALTGKPLWNAHDHASLTGTMSSSFVSNPVPVDRNNNGLVDLLYAADVGGRVWRFDINEDGNTPASFAKGGVIADLNDDTTLGNRRFYNSPDISYYRNNGDDFVLISIGSGYRAHPLYNGVQDYHFLIKDRHAKETPDDYQAISLNDLKEWGQDDSDHGWYVSLRYGEKVLANSSTLRGTVAFTTYTPNDPATTVACDGDLGTARMYTLDIHSKGQQEKTEQVLQQTGIPPTPVIITPSNPIHQPETPPGEEAPPPLDCQSFGSQLLVGPEAIAADLNRCGQIRRTFWREKPL